MKDDSVETAQGLLETVNRAIEESERATKRLWTVRNKILELVDLIHPQLAADERLMDSLRSKGL